MNMTESPVAACVLITGASSGIGAGLAREFVRRGVRVALVARRMEQLEALATELRAAGGQASAHRGDVTVDGDIARVVAEVAALGATPRIVIANAGFGVVGNAQTLTLADYRRQFETNVFGVLRTFHETIDVLRAAQGRFVIMGSVAGYLSAAGGSPYAMSKFAVRALAEALHGELRATGVGCTLISPGFVDSDIRRVDNRGGFHAGVKDPIPEWLRMKTATAARQMARGILRGKKEVIVTVHARLMIFMTRQLPGLIRWLLLRSNRGSRPEPRQSN
ncbi:MAG TPA: SDR family NAD(P)-dependent oxidoreductase [Steroidobacteraceae bacterium]|jgi:short-subunit dehydrogenase|nr:SDR family NAD(P)-dependent oxidoreductase [Steroidobacteraceae bacterium]